MFQFLRTHLTTVPIRIEGWSLVAGSLLTILIIGVCSYATQHGSWVPYAWADLGMSGAAVISNGMILVMLAAIFRLLRQLMDLIVENQRLARAVHERQNDLT